MKRRLAFPLLCLVLTYPLFAVQKPYETGKVIDVQQKATTRVLYYIVNTPVTQDDPYYEVSVQLKDTIYVGQYTPRHASDGLPDDLQADAGVQVRVEKHHMYIKRPGGIDLDLILLKHNVAKSEPKAQQPAPAKP